MKILFQSKWFQVLVLVCFTSSCAVKSHQFADAVNRGNLEDARMFHEPGFEKMKFSLVEAPGKYALPIQYAILYANRAMAKFLLDNGSQNTLNGQNLTYYCSINGQSEMAHYFASIGEGSYADISRAQRDLAAKRERDRRASEMTALVGLGVLALIISSGMGSGGNDPYELSPQEKAADLRSHRALPAPLRAGF